MNPTLTVALLLCASLSATPALADSISVSGLPETKQSNGTQETFVFDVVVEVDQGNCAGGSQEFTVTLKADVENRTGDAVTAEVIPSSYTVTIGPSDTVQSSAQYPKQATLVVNANGLTVPVAANTIVTAKADTPSCLVPIGAVGGAGPFEEARANTTVEFQPAGGPNDGNGPAEEPVPGLGIPIILAIVAAVLLLRRK